MIIDEVHEYQSKGLYERIKTFTLKSKPVVYIVTFHGAKIHPEAISENVKRIVDKLIDLGCVNPISPVEITDAFDYYNRLCGIIDFRNLNGGDKDAACQKGNDSD